MRKKLWRLMLAVAVLAPVVTMITSFDADVPSATASNHAHLVVSEINGPHDQGTLTEGSGGQYCIDVKLGKAPSAGDVDVWIRTHHSWGNAWGGSTRYVTPSGWGVAVDTGLTFDAENWNIEQQYCVTVDDDAFVNGNWDEATHGPRAVQNADGSWSTTPCDISAEHCYGPSFKVYPRSTTAAEYDCGAAGATCPSGITDDADLVWLWWTRVIDDECCLGYTYADTAGNACTQSDPCVLTEGVAATINIQHAGNPHWAMGGLGGISSMPDGRFPAGHDPGKGISDTNCTQTSGGHTFTLANWATEVGTLTWECADDGVVEHPQPVEIRLETTGLLVPWVTIGCGGDDGAVNNTGACQHEPVLYFNKVDPNLSETGTITAFGDNDDCSNQTIPYDNTGNISLTLQVTHNGTVVHTSTVAAGASGTLDDDYTGAINGSFVASLISTYDGDVIATESKTLDCADGDGDGYTADVDCDDADPSVPGAPSGYQLMQNQNGTPQSVELVCGLQLRGFPGSIIKIDPLPECAYWEFNSPTRIMVRVFILSEGNGDPAATVVAEKNGSGLHQHDYGMLWIGSQIDHDGNTGVGSNNRWKPRGWNGHDVYNDPVRVGYNPTNNKISWYDPDSGGTWRDGDYVPEGYEPYLAFVHNGHNSNQNVPTVTTVTDTCADTDADGIYDFDEESGCENDADCDDDGVQDGDELAGCIQDADCDDDGLGDFMDLNDSDPDQDDDGVQDGDELGGCVTNADCDGDGVQDGNEQDPSCIQDADCDDDGLDDADDIDDLDPDRDNDGVEDGDEEAPQCRTLVDCDDDGLDDADDPDDTNPDVDDDGVNDGDEPAGCITLADCDDDGVDDGDEQDVLCITDNDCDDDGLGDPDDDDDLNPDQDSDGVDDGEEQDPSCINVVDCDDDGVNDNDDEDDLDPNIPLVAPDDTDDDGVTDVNEQDESCIDDADCDDDGLGDLPDEDDLDPDQDDDGVEDGDEEGALCRQNPDCDNDGTGDAVDPDDTDPSIPVIVDEVTGENQDSDGDGEADTVDVGDGNEVEIIVPEEDDTCPNEGEVRDLSGECIPLEEPGATDDNNDVAKGPSTGGEVTPTPIVDVKENEPIYYQVSCTDAEGTEVIVLVNEDAVPVSEVAEGTLCPVTAEDIRNSIGTDGESTLDEVTLVATTDSRNLVSRFFDLPWYALTMIFSFGGAAIAALPWWLRFRSLFAALGGSTGPFLFVAWRRGWYCQHCEKKIKDKDVDACEHCGEDITSETGLEPKRAFSFPQYLRLVWANRENKEVLERLKTDQDYVYALLADLEKAEQS